MSIDNFEIRKGEIVTVIDSEDPAIKRNFQVLNIGDKVVLQRSRGREVLLVDLEALRQGGDKRFKYTPQSSNPSLRKAAGIVMEALARVDQEGGVIPDLTEALENLKQPHLEIYVEKNSITDVS